MKEYHELRRIARVYGCQVEELEKVVEKFRRRIERLDEKIRIMEGYV